MQLTLVQKEIEKAIVDFVASKGVALENTNVHVTLIASRGPQGMTATIDISTGFEGDLEEDEPDVVEKPTPPKPRAKAAKPAPKQEEEPPPFDVEAPAETAAEVDESPFGQPAKSADPEPQPAEEKEEVADEEKPLFGQ